jgi:hypothetical protein
MRVLGKQSICQLLQLEIIIFMDSQSNDDYYCRLMYAMFLSITIFTSSILLQYISKVFTFLAFLIDPLHKKNPIILSEAPPKKEDCSNASNAEANI